MSPSSALPRFLGFGLILLGLTHAVRAADIPRGEKYALLVGVKEYPPGQMRSLLFPENDVKDLAEVLKVAGYRSENVTVMTHESSATNSTLLPTCKNIRAELSRLSHACTPGDTVMVAFAGHGIQFKNEEDSYFCPFDVDLKDRKSMISMKDIYSDLGRCKADLRLLLVDACRNDPYNRLDRGPQDEFESVTTLQKTPPPGGVLALFSCSASQEAVEDTTLKHGVFFHFVIQGLLGDAAGDDETPDQITLPQMEYFVKKRVADHVWAKFKKRQEPEMKTRGSVGLYPLVRLKNRQKDAAVIRDSMRHRLKGHHEQAEAILTKGAQIDPENIDLLFHRARARERNEQYAGAIADFTKILELDAENSEAYFCRGKARYDNEDYTGALSDLGHAIQLNPKYSRAYFQRGVVLQVQKSYEEATENYSKAIALNPRFDMAFYNRAMIKEYIDQDYEAAQTDYDKAREIDPYDNDYRTRLACVQNRLGNSDAALENLNKVTTLNPTDSEAIYQRAAVYHGRGDYERATRDYDRVLQFNPRHETASLNRSLAQDRRGHNDSGGGGGFSGRDSMRPNRDFGDRDQGRNNRDSSRQRYDNSQRDSGRSFGGGGSGGGGGGRRR